MCDYSLHAVASRPAKVGDKLITTEFSNTPTRGFTAIGEPSVAVCLLPGTEVAFDENVRRRTSWLDRLFRRNTWRVTDKVGRFRQINADNPHAHHDAIEFPDGTAVLVTLLQVGQRVTVLQLPVQARIPDGSKVAAPVPPRSDVLHAGVRRTGHPPRTADTARN